MSLMSSVGEEAGTAAEGGFRGGGGGAGEGTGSASDGGGSEAAGIITVEEQLPVLPRSCSTSGSVDEGTGVAEEEDARSLEAAAVAAAAAAELRANARADKSGKSVTILAPASPKRALHTNGTWLRNWRTRADEDQVLARLAQEQLELKQGAGSGADGKPWADGDGGKPALQRLASKRKSLRRYDDAESERVLQELRMDKLGPPPRRFLGVSAAEAWRAVKVRAAGGGCRRGVGRACGRVGQPGLARERGRGTWPQQQQQPPAWSARWGGPWGVC